MSHRGRCVAGVTILFLTTGLRAGAQLAEKGIVKSLDEIAFPAAPAGQAASRRPGGLAMMPSKAKRRFACKSTNPCTFFVVFDRTYDVFWVDKTR